MPRRAKPLSAQKVQTAKPRSSPYWDGDGLGLIVRKAPKADEPNPAFWLFQFTSPTTHRRREMGGGRARGKNAVGLAAARAWAAQQRRLVKDGVDPLAERVADAARKAAAAAAETAAAITFKDVSDRYLSAHEASWRNPKHRQQWRNTLRDYVRPTLGELSVSAIGTGEIMKIIEPLWQEKPETASRVRGRIETLLDYAAARGWRQGDNPARWRGHLANLLPPRSRVQKVEHHPALPWREVGGFMAKLREHGGTSARAAEFTILTAARSGEVRGARWGEIDLAHKVWTLPADRTKAGREHRVPLSDAAVSVLQGVAPLRSGPDAFVFPGGRENRPLSDVALSKAVKGAGGDGLTLHGFRSTFRDWAAEFDRLPARGGRSGARSRPGRQD